MPASSQATHGPSETSGAVLPTVLVVDDDQDDLFFIRRLLADGGVANPIAVFNDSSEAFAFLRGLVEGESDAAKPCTMFLDVKMPKVHGFVLLKWVRQQPALDRMHVVMLSGSNDPADRLRCEKLGADRYLVKFPPAEVMAEAIAASCAPPT